MSEKFGLDWKQYDYQRMQDFILIHNIQQKDVSSNGTSTTNSRKVNRDGN
jgi:hypothetical protein